MKLLSLHMHIASYALIMLFFMVATWFVANSLFTVAGINFCLDPLIGQEAQENIKHRSVSCMQKKWYKPSAVFSIAEDFPYIKTISSTMRANNRVCLHVTAYMPTLCINDQWLLLENDICIPIQVFEPFYCKDIPTIHMPELFDQKLKPFELMALKKVPYELFSRYKITFYDPTDIELHDIEFPHFYIRTDHESIGAFNYEAVDTVRMDLQSKRLLQQRNKRWIVDVRFKNQMIVNSELIQGGAV